MATLYRFELLTDCRRASKNTQPCALNFTQGL